MLNIPHLNFNKIANSCNTNKIFVNKGLSNDVFVRSIKPISFKGSERKEVTTSFVDWANKTDFINSQLKDIITSEEYKLGSGFTNTAFEIPNNDECILRVRTGALDNIYMPNIEKATIVDTDDNLDINIGQKVAEITIPSEHARAGEADYCATTVEVLKKQSGESIGVQPPETLVADEWGTPKAGVEPYEAMSRKEKYARTIHQVAKLPVEAYEDLLVTYKKACEAGYALDHLNSNNLLIDANKGSINMIDMDKRTNGSTTPNYSNLLYSLTNISYFSTYNMDYVNPVGEENKRQSLDDSVEIISKFMEAMQNQGLKFKRSNASYEFGLSFITSLPARFYCQSFDDNAFWKKADSMGVLS